VAKRVKKHREAVNFGPFATPQAWKRAGLLTSGVGRAGKKSGAFTIVTRSVQHGEILPASLNVAKGCITKGGKPPRAGQVELVFLKRGMDDLPPGPALRFCTEAGKGQFLPVKDPREAKKIAQRYQSCVGGDRKKQKACIVEHAKE